MEQVCMMPDYVYHGLGKLTLSLNCGRLSKDGMKTTFQIAKFPPI